VDQVHRPFSLARLTCTELTHSWPVREEALCFSRGGAPAGGELAASLRGGAGVRLGRGKTSLGHGDYVCGVKVVAKAPQGAGHGERRLELHRRAGNSAGLRHRLILWCAWATQHSNGYVWQGEGSSRGSGGFGHDGGFSSTTAVSMRRLRPRRSVTVEACKSLRVLGVTARAFRLNGGARILMWPLGASRWPRRS